MRADWDTMPSQECGLNIDDGYINKTLSKTEDVWYTGETGGCTIKSKLAWPRERSSDQTEVLLGQKPPLGSLAIMSQISTLRLLWSPGLWEERDGSLSGYTSSFVSHRRLSLTETLLLYLYLSDPLPPFSTSWYFLTPCLLIPTHTPSGFCHRSFTTLSFPILLSLPLFLRAPCVCVCLVCFPF